MADDNSGFVTYKDFAELSKDVSTMKPTVERLDDEFFNHDGGPGLKRIVLEHIASVNSRAQEREKAEKTALALASENEKKAASARKLARKVAVGVAMTLLSIAGWVGHTVWVIVAPPIAAIIEEYYEHHPGAVHRGYFEIPPNPSVSSNQHPPQDAGNKENRPWQQTQ